MLNESFVANISYCDRDGNKSDRRIVPVSVPKDSVRAIDVSDLSPGQQDEMERLVREYKEYMDNILKAAFTFEGWVEHSYNETIVPKWRSFKVHNITENY